MPSASRADPAFDPGRSLVLPAGGLELSLAAEVSLSVRHIAEPWSLAPDAYVGITDHLTAGVTHSVRAQSLIDAGSGLCLDGDSGECASVYDGPGVDLRFLHWQRGGLAVASRVRLQARRFDPLKLAIKPGVLVRATRGDVTVLTDPYVSVGLTNIDRGNDHFLNLPLWGIWQLGGRVALHLRSGVHGVLRDFADAYRIPIGVGAAVQLGGGWRAGADLGMNKLIGPQNDLKPRHLQLFVTWARSPVPCR
jgi:hypothetical protein